MVKSLLAIVVAATSFSLRAEAVPEAYARLWNDSVNAGIDERIEKYRKADARVEGFAPGAEVQVEQLTHAFQFGSHIFNFDQLGRDDWNAQYRATFTNLWNAATVAFYWNEMEPEEGKIRYAAGPRDSAEFWKSVKDMSAKEKWEKFAEYRRPAPDPVVDFLKANGVSMHGHPMVYPMFSPAWVSNGVDKVGLAARYERRIRQLGKHYGGQLDQWDVVNETVDRSCSMAGPYHDKVVWGRPNHLVPDDYTYLCHKWAAETFPAGVRLEMNDSWRPIYVPFTQSLIDRGAKIDVVGLQMHIFGADEARKIAAGEPCIANGTDWSPEAQFQMLWALDTLKRPIHISEITIPAPDDTEAGYEAQARMIRDNYRLWFSWPSVYRITYWNLVDHTYHKENLSSGLYTSDMRKKMAYYVLDDLINRVWKTRLTVRADDTGAVTFRGFRGLYRLTSSGKSAIKEVGIVEPGAIADDCVVRPCDSQTRKECVRTARIYPEAPGGVFIEDEIVSFRADGVPPERKCQVLDWLGVAVAEGAFGAGGSLRLSGIPVGYYRLSLEGCHDATFAVVPDPAKRVRDVRSFVGVDSALSWCWRPGSVDCPWYDGDTFRLGRELLIRSGVPHVRERLCWGEVQGRVDKMPQWGRYLVNARELSKSGVFVTGMFHDAPAWTGFVGKHLPSDLKALHDFCVAFSRDFSGFMTDCEFWNEQDISNLSDEGAWDFAACMKAAFLGFRQGNPRLAVAPGAVCRDGRNAYDDILYRNDMGKYCDVFNFHTYNSVASLPSLAADARRQLSRAGITDRALWMTECGTNREGPALGGGGKEGIRAASPLQELVWAESIPKTQLVNLFNGVSRSYTFVFAPYNEQGGIKDWGIVRRDGTVKPSFPALSTLASEVGDGAELLGRLRFADGKAVGYLFRKGDSSQTLVYWSLSSMDEGNGIITELPLGERRFSLAAKDGEYRLADMCGRVTHVRSSGGRLKLTATRYPAYVSGLSGLKPEEVPVPPGRVGPVPTASDEDLSVIVRIDADRDDFRLGAGRSRLEMSGDRGKIRVSVWNLDGRTKHGTLTVSGGTLSGMPKDMAIPAGGVVRFDAVYTPDFKEGGCEAELRIDGKFDGRRTTSCIVPMYSERLFLKTARFVTLDAMRPERWMRNTSAQKYSCVWDEKERALRFDVEWTEPVDRWFYPQYALAEGETLEGARQLVFEVRTEQDKVENDFVAALAFFRSATSGYERPFRTWERRSVELPRLVAEPLTGFSLGCNPKGRKLSFWLRNLRVVYGKTDKKGND